MKVTTPEISWHERDPIYSVDVQPGNRAIKRLVSGGVDKFVRVWQIKEDLDGKYGVEFLANLKRHTKAVNVCRFSPDGDILATAGDDSVIIFWKLSETSSINNIFQEDEEDNKENWAMLKVLRGHLEDIYDICWSADGKYMISGSVDNSAILWDLTKDQKMGIFNEHKSFVQGVAWDPKNELVATLSTDRSCRIYNICSRSCIHNVHKMTLPSKPQTTEIDENKDTENKDTKPKSFRMFHDDTMRSFFRRLTFTPDGELLIVPAGCVEADPVTNATFIFTRHCLSKPALYLPSPEKVTIAVRCCPTKFQLRKIQRKQNEEKSTEKASEDLKEWEKYSTLFCLPYQTCVFAVATEDSIQSYMIHNRPQPIWFFITNIHYHQLQ
ncbi:chromatin assembly factor 1 subunit B-like [Ruditapes philippinarum]|uniref:chromatin assembly factor 1 subunit B-like n=1 Tax=Ruditapes philippinarum TaxID=129788 RepID=UPI00295BBB38|nr:chromatin assembly factor 1 subunit B-like [Ruditapes philippinarum]